MRNHFSDNRYIKVTDIFEYLIVFRHFISTNCLYCSRNLMLSCKLRRITSHQQRQLKERINHMMEVLLFVDVDCVFCVVQYVAVEGV